MQKFECDIFGNFKTLWDRPDAFDDLLAKIEWTLQFFGLKVGLGDFLSTLKFPPHNSWVWGYESQLIRCLGQTVHNNNVQDAWLHCL